MTDTVTKNDSIHRKQVFPDLDEFCFHVVLGSWILGPNFRFLPKIWNFNQDFQPTIKSFNPLSNFLTLNSNF